MAKREGPTGLAGGLFGILVFLAGVALLALAFQRAFVMFDQNPISIFTDPKQKGVLDLGSVVPKFLGVLVQIMLLLVMSVVGGMVANRGIRLYADARASGHKKD